MPNWKKVIVSGSNASINKLNVATSVTASSYTGSFVGDGSQLTGIQASVSEVTGSLVVSGSNTTIGTSTVSGSFVTTGSFTVTAKGVGTAWSAGANLTSRWGTVAAVGTQTSGLAWGGIKLGYNTAGYKVGGDTEEYDGTNWSTGGTRPADVYYTKGFGTQGAAVSFGGKSYSTAYETNAVHKYDGTSWTAGNDLPAPRADGGGAGVETAGLVAGGQHLYAYAYFTTNTYEYNGTNWSAGGTLPELGFDNVSIAGTQTDAILLGNSSASNAAGSSKQSAATYDGTSWTTIASTDSDRGNVVGSKADYALAVNSGLGNSTYIWTGTNWAITANSLTTRNVPAMGDGNGGADSSGFIVGGLGPTELTSTEEFNNSLSVINSLNVTKKLNQNVSATGSFHGKFTGDGSALVLDSNVVFDDEESTFTKNIRFEKALTHGAGFVLTGSTGNNSTDLQIGVIGETDVFAQGYYGVRINTGSFGHYLDETGTGKSHGKYQVQAPNFVISKNHAGEMDDFPGLLWPWASSSIYHHLDQRIGDKFYDGLHFDFGGISGITASANIVIEPSGSLIVAPKNGGILAVSGSIIPGTNEAYDLGSSTHRWRDLYLSGSTIDLGGTKISRDSTGDIEFKVDGNRKSLKVDELHIGSGAGARKLKVSAGKLKFTTISDTKDLDSTTDITASAVQADGATLGDFTVDGDLTVNGSIIGASAFASLALTGTPSAPTPTSNDNSTKIATTAYVQQELTDLIGTAPSTLDTFGELSASMAADETALSSLTTTVGTKLAKTSNLSDLSDVSTARTNLGLGTSNHAQFHCLGIGTTASTVNGEIRAAGDITAYYSSDERLKENFQTLDGALDKINQINGYEFDWKEGIEDVVSKEGHDIGVKAQELQAVYPELVHERDNGYLAVDYVKLTAVLLQAVKELSTKVDKLENK